MLEQGVWLEMRPFNDSRTEWVLSLLEILKDYMYKHLYRYKYSWCINFSPPLPVNSKDHDYYQSNSYADGCSDYFPVITIYSCLFCHLLQVETRLWLKALRQDDITIWPYIIGTWILPLSPVAYRFSTYYRSWNFSPFQIIYCI